MTLAVSATALVGGELTGRAVWAEACQAEAVVLQVSTAPGPDRKSFIL